MPKKLTPAQKKQAESKLKRRYEAEKKKHDRQNRRRKIKVDWPYEDFLDWVARLGHLILDLGEWGVVSIADWIDSWVGDCDQEEGEFKGTYPSWHEKAGEEVCVKCPAGTYFAGWDRDTGSPICARYTEDQEGYVPRPKDEVQDPVPPPARRCLEDGGFPTYSPKLGKNICVMCPDGGTFVGFNDDGDPICGEPNPAPETLEEQGSGGMQKRRRRVRRKPKGRQCNPPAVKAFSPKTGKGGCYRCKNPDHVFQGFDASGNPRCGPKRKSVTTKGTRRKRKAETPEERIQRIKDIVKRDQAGKQAKALRKAREEAERRKQEKESSVTAKASSSDPISKEEQYRMQFIETFGHDEEESR